MLAPATITSETSSHTTENESVISEIALTQSGDECHEILCESVEYFNCKFDN